MTTPPDGRADLIQVRRDVAADWESVNPILAEGELGYDTTNGILKIGDGETAWTDLEVLHTGRYLLPDGGTTGQALVKASGTDRDVEWGTVAGGGGGAVDSVNGSTGDVVLDADDIDDTSTTNKFATAAQLSAVDGLASTYQPLDSDLTAIAALSTTAYGRALLVLADQAALQTAVNVEDGADVTDTANVTAAGALMDSEVTNLAAVKAFDPADYAADDHDHDSDYVALATLSSAGKGVVAHGATAGTARPSGFASIEWIGSVEPTNAVDGDTWIDTA